MIQKLIYFTLLILLYSCNIKKENSEKESGNTLLHAYMTDSMIHKPTKFHPEVVSTQIDKFNTSFNPAGDTIYYTVTSQKLGLTGIAFQKFEQGSFSEPEFVPFVSADIPMADVQISPDGKLMLFSTFKDYEGKPEGFNFNIWTSVLKNGIWQEPKPLGAPISSAGNEFYPVMTNNRNIYFNSDKGGNSDLYVSRFQDGKYQEPQRLPDHINSQGREADAFISGDESIMIFVRVDQPDGFGNSDLYISFRNSEDQWSEPVNMGANVNSDQVDGSPYITPDNQYLIFTSGRVPPGIKEKAVQSYRNFKNIAASSENGSLNFYIMNLNLDQYRKSFISKAD